MQQAVEQAPGDVDGLEEHGDNGRGACCAKMLADGSVHGMQRHKAERCVVAIARGEVDRHGIGHRDGLQMVQHHITVFYLGRGDTLW